MLLRYRCRRERNETRRVRHHIRESWEMAAQRRWRESGLGGVGGISMNFKVGERVELIAEFEVEGEA